MRAAALPPMAFLPMFKRASMALAILGALGASAGHAQPDRAPDAPPVADSPPDVPLSGRLLYQLMAAELALQNGDPGAAYATFMAVARETRDARIARRAVEVAINARVLPEALAAARLWRELAPASDESLQALAMLAAGNGLYDEVAELFAPAVKRAPATELARIQQMLVRAPDRAGALRALERLAAPYRDDPKDGADVRLTLAAAAHAAGQRDRALAEARAALAARPDSERGALIVTQLLAQGATGPDGRPARQEAIGVLEAFLKRKPDSVEARLALARLLVGEQRFPAALTQFQEALKRDPKNLDALFAAGVLALEGPPPHGAARGYLTRYLAALEESPDERRDTDSAYLNLARVAEEERKFTEALDWLAKIDDGPQVFQALLRRAVVLAKLGRLDEARRELAAAQPATDEQRVQRVVAEAQALREAKRTIEAYYVLARALAASPDDSTLLYETAMAAEKLDRLDVLERHLRRLIELKPDEPHAYNALGYTLADRNLRLAEARELIEQALKRAPEDAYIIDSLGWVLFRQGDLAGARRELQRAWTLRPHAEVGAHYGEVLWVSGEREQARAIWMRSREMEPDNETLRSTLERLRVGL